MPWLEGGQNSAVRAKYFVFNNTALSTEPLLCDIFRAISFYVVTCLNGSHDHL